LNKKKILLFTDWYEPGYKAGGPIQSCGNFVSAMQDDYNLFVITSDRDFGDANPYQNIIPDTWIKKNETVQLYYSFPKKLTQKKIEELINFINPDYIYLNSLYSYHFTIIPLWLKKTNRLAGDIIISPRGMLQQGALKFKSAKKKLFIQLLNLMGIAKQLIFHATDEQESKDVLKYFPSAKQVVIIPNLPKAEIAEWKQITKRPGKLKCVFVSRLSPKKNLLFLLTVLKQLPGNLDLHLDLYGEIENDLYWQKCKDIIDSLSSNISVNYNHSVPNNMITEIMQQHHLFVLPTLGENFGHAIFEAFLAGKPVLISDKTPWINLERKKIGNDLPLDVTAFGNALKFYGAMDQDEYDEWSKNALLFSQEYLANSDTVKKYKQLFS
jgi:glycosyltransferase involved in cell wall biosynthesis